ncbi:MAG: hypothetical protein GY842_06070, partial [bacterium]|nr:hypothetical protein [bacterium]
MNHQDRLVRTLNRTPGRAFGLAAALAGLSAGVASAAPAELRIDRSPTSGRVTFVTAADGGAISVQSAFSAQPEPADFLVEHGYLFGVSDPSEQLSRTSSETDFIGYRRTTYQQVHEGVPVFSGTLKVHQNRAGQISAANGDFYRISPKLRTTPSISS